MTSPFNPDVLKRSIVKPYKPPVQEVVNGEDDKKKKKKITKPGRSGQAKLFKDKKVNEVGGRVVVPQEQKLREDKLPNVGGVSNMAGKFR